MVTPSPGSYLGMYYYDSIVYDCANLLHTTDVLSIDEIHPLYRHY